MQKISPCLWFDTNAEEAVNFYLSVFKNGKIHTITRYGKEGFEVHGMQEGTVMTIVFELFGQTYMALNGGPHFKFNEAISLMVECDNQAELDDYWSKLSAHKESEQCGWLKDKFGMSWQIVPKVLGEMMKDQSKTERVMRTILQMKKIDIATLKAAA